MSDPEAIEMEGQAERWFVRLREPDCTDEERAACARWRAVDPTHEAAFRDVESIWQRSGEFGDDPLIAAALHAAERDKAPRQQRWRHAWRWAVPLVATLAALALLTSRIPPKSDPPAMSYHTEVGERYRIELPDGTAVVLDTNTDLVVRYTNQRRLIDLSQGQAQFEVTHDVQRPFIVRAIGGTVTATGTQFDVRVQNAAATVTLLEGSVVVEAPADTAQSHPPTILSPGQQLRFDRTGREWSTVAADLASARAWTQGNLLANNWLLPQLVAEMNRYSATPIRLADPALANVRISGTFRAGDQDALTLVLEHGWPVRAARRNGEIVLSRAPTSRR
ncbi:MAG: FecR domain-containing protein [Rudaea sp.]|uniref:FecR family protein n=1 Tax=Rudaea sp. TaxID=2136325 RepID=UPI0039E321A2